MTEVKVHPTAIIDANAKIGANSEIGPFSIVGPDVTIGEQTTVQSHVVIEAEVAIGRGNFIGHGAIIGVPPQDVSFSPERKTKVEIGDNNIIREYCTIHRGSTDGSVTKIGDKNFLMAGAHSAIIASSETTSSLRTIVCSPAMFAWMTAHFLAVDQLFISSCTLAAW